MSQYPRRNTDSSAVGIVLAVIGIILMTFVAFTWEAHTHSRRIEACRQAGGTPVTRTVLYEEFVSCLPGSTETP